MPNTTSAALAGKLLRSRSALATPTSRTANPDGGGTGKGDGND